MVAINTTPVQPAARSEDNTRIGRRRHRARRSTLAPGQRVGAWRIDGELGRGGMGTVYAVTHNGFGKRAALKLCHESILDADVSARTFLREARIVHLVDHPGVPDVFATGTFDGRPYLAMERLSGETLGQRLARGPMPRAEAIDLLLELCDVLEAAHDAFVIHRDLKLDNVFVLDQRGAGGRGTKLLDWGIARVGGEDDPMRGLLAGTLTYAAPEQIRGDDVTAATDLYALAVVAYQLLLGQPPFGSRSELELIQLHLRQPPPSPVALWPDIPDELATLLVAMLAKDPARRPAVAEVERVLRQTRDGLDQRPRSWRDQLRAIPIAPPLDVLGRPVVMLGVNHRAAGVALGIASMIATAVALVSA